MQDEHHKPPPLPPTPIAYARPAMPNPRPPAPSAAPIIIRFFAGLIAGAILSGIVYVGGWKIMNDNQVDWIILAIPLVKLVVGIVFLCIRGWRSAGAGVLVSIALGVLIFMGACMINLNTPNTH